MKRIWKLIPLLYILFYLSACTKKDDISTCLLTVDIQLSEIDNGTKRLRAVASGGVEPYRYEWHAFPGDVEGIYVTHDGLPYNGDPYTFGPGEHILTVVDALGCEVSDSVTITFHFPCGSVNSITDADGNVYDVVAIGTQCWTKQDLRVSASVPQITDSLQWASTVLPAWCYYGNNSTNGKLYNWYAVQSGNLCPAGWHIPTETEWQQLTTFIGDPAGGKMKSTTSWDSPNTGATNSSGFNAVGSGYRSYLSGNFYGLKQIAGFWASTQATDTTAFSRAITYDSEWFTNLPVPKRQGYSCRCIKD